MAKIKSKRFKLIKEDIVKWAKNALIFFAPALILFLTQIQQGVPLKEALNAIYLWGINITIDLLRKYAKETKY